MLEESFGLVKKVFFGSILLSLFWFFVFKELFSKYLIFMFWFGVVRRLYFLKDMRDVDMVNIVGLVMLVFRGSFDEKFKKVFGWLFLLLIFYVLV